MLWPKKNSYNEFDNEKKFMRLENFIYTRVLIKTETNRLKRHKKKISWRIRDRR